MTREEAIDVLKHNYPSSCYEDLCKAVDMAIEALEQPEIIRCRDCKHWLPHEQIGFDESNEEYHDYCEMLIPEDEYYAFYRGADEWCSRAERREEGGE